MQLFLLEVKRVLKTRTTWILLVASLLLTMVLAYLPTTFHSYHWPDQNDQQILISLTIPLKTLYLQGFSPFITAHFMYFPLFLPLRAETRESFYSPQKLVLRLDTI